MRSTPRPRPRRTPRPAPWLRPAATALLGLIALLVALAPRPALAAGTVTLANREPVEEDGRWKLKMTVDYGSIPQLPHIPMIFAFTPMVLYERSLTDKSPEKPVVIKMPLQNQTVNNESMDVGFSDGSGKIFKVTKFDFVIRRDHGFEAGEYDLKIKREDDGVQMGQTIRIILKGDNAVVDRRAMVFAGDKPKSKKIDADKKDESAGGADEKKDEPASGGEEKKADDGEEKKGGDDVPKVPPKQGGCGCEVAGGDGVRGGALALTAALALAATRRRRRRAARA
jgi:MYXO-CTERM domain-containing protein